MAEGGRNPPDAETQKKDISALLKSPLVKGENWYLIDQKWLKQWKKYIGFENYSVVNADDSSFPGAIDNSSLFKDDGSGEIRDNLVEEMEYCLVPEKAWELLVDWYGTIEGSEQDQAISRTVVEYGMFVKHYKVEVYLIEFQLCENSDPEKVIARKFSKVDTIEYIEKEMRELFEISETKETRLWNKYSSNTYEYLNNKQSTVQDAGLYPGQVLIIEQQNEDNTWPRQTRSTSAALTYSGSTTINNSGGVGENRVYNAPSNMMATRSYGSSGGSGGGGGNSSNYGGNNYDYDYHNGTTCSIQGGLCGLSNLGNTCFMNSALQCMSNTPPLTEYFLDDKYWDELNAENPLGMHGEIAKFYGELVKTMWSGRCAYTIPRNFKVAVGRFAPQFSGYQQQDCQELMAFLLDGLHEDLNRVKKKPYIELKDGDGRTDEIVAEEAWKNYLKRNNSIIVDIFHGLLKSTVVCPKCAKVSVTFDPFCYLSLPLPLKRERHQEVVLVPGSPAKRYLRLKVTVPKLGTIQDLCNVIGEMTGCNPEYLIVTEVYNNKFHKIFQMGDPLNAIAEKDVILVYEIETAHDDPSTLLIPVFMRKRKRMMKQAGKFVFSMNPLLGQPSMLALSKKELPTYEKLYKILMKQMSRFVTEPHPDDQWWLENDLEKQNIEVDPVTLPGSTDCGDKSAAGVGASSTPSGSGSNEETTGGEEGGGQQPTSEEDEELNDLKCPPRLFSIHSVNSYGNSVVEKLFDDGKPLKLTAKTNLAIDWHPRGREKFFDEEEVKEVDDHESVNTKLSQKKQVIQLSECLKLFTTTEKLGVDDPWYCPACKKHQQATKKFDLWSLPKVLIIHLKRFSYNRYWRDKLDVLVEFPVTGLNLAKYVIDPRHPPSTYDLTAVANHYGGMGGGHYTAYAKNKGTGQWYYFDDSSVSSSTEDCVVSKAAYVLYYMRRDPNQSHHPSSGGGGGGQLSRSPSASSTGSSQSSNYRNIPAALGAPPPNSRSGNSLNDKDTASSDDDMDCS